MSDAGEGNPGGWALAETNVGQMSFYMQDEWNVSDKLKLTYGVRFDKPLFFDTSNFLNYLWFAKKMKKSNEVFIQIFEQKVTMHLCNEEQLLPNRKKRT